MTCIVGMIEDGRVWIGGDSAGCSDNELEIRKDPKVFVSGEFVFGYTSSFRMGQLLRFSLCIPERPLQTDPYEYMATLFVNSVRECFKEGGLAKTDNGVETAGTFLVGYCGRLFCVDDDFQVVELWSPFMAIGWGRAYAIGALEILYPQSGEPQDKLTTALKVASKWCAWVHEPFVFASEPQER